MELKKNTKFEILTPSGFQDFVAVRKLNKSIVYKIQFSNNKYLKCSDSHRFISNGSEIFASDLRVGTFIDSISHDRISVTSIELTDNLIELYDVVEVDNGNLFIVDGLISHNCDFITSGHSVIEGTTLKWYSATTVQTPIEKRGFDGNIWIWEQADYSKNYIVIADVARGDGADYSTFQVLDVESVTQVAEYKGQLSTKDFGNMLVAIATEYNDALLVIENANIGWAVIQVAIDRSYKNLYYSPKENALSDVSQQLSRYTDLKDTANLVAGFTTSSRSRPLVISKLDMYMRERVPVIRSNRLIDELFVFVWNGSKAEAQHGYNDDLVMAFSIGLWIRDTALRLRQQGIELNRKALDFVQKSSGVYTQSAGMMKATGWSQNIGHNIDEDLTWLIK